MKTKILHNGRPIAEDVLLATTMYTRLIGLMFRAAPPENAKGLLLDPCRSIHTCFMRYALDVVFLSSDNTVVKVIRNLRPWRMTWIYFRASKTLELPAGELPVEVREGERLEVENV